MKYKFNIKDAFVITISILLYSQVILFIISFFVPGQKGEFIVRLSVKYLSEQYYFVRIVGTAWAMSSVILWFWMLLDWGTRTFVKKKYKIYWFIIFFSTYVFGATIYYFKVCKFRKGLRSEEEKA
jgi:hypothetical protein